MKTMMFVIGLVFLGMTTGVKAQEYSLKDVVHFKKMMSQGHERLTSEIIEKEYLIKGTKGVEIFTPNRIINAENMAKKIAADPAAYEKALRVCLPGARLVEAEAFTILGNVKRLLQQEKSAPTYIVLGGNNSGGTASGEGFTLGLEVICGFVDTPEQAGELIKTFVAHEVVHVYQAWVITEGESLLYLTLKEGFADFIANLVIGEVSASEKERHDYGMKNEARIWQKFQKEMAGTSYKYWMYGAGRDDQPADMGYWLGKRIAEAYYKNARDKQQALQDLLYLKNPKDILVKSGYNPG